MAMQKSATTPVLQEEKKRERAEKKGTPLKTYRFLSKSRGRPSRAVFKGEPKGNQSFVGVPAF